ncbi:MAG: AlbA family DNA-binding domain-containing protein [Burkholderiaceae bacterium]
MQREDIDHLLGTEEGRKLDFKRELPTEGRESRNDFADDIVALANTAGGDLIFGVDETQGVAIAVTPFVLNRDAAIKRLENFIHSGIKPS